ncbi:histidinol dehydrogenase [Thermosulfuriphilus ammonigenes]|uniref:Histidinol dehydrogenase n=1 Tax=Thermosulfuriphilus ammonigenes TaxID=1936021 RepID=A0A6G7PW58_9BACT|nr:histidinol dehydrogenase [Thermosulfuriphilus ammonigenes]MBA2847885.1 histidinol dehydrogenase [Thermosulfuriphilus ammonigenes]QIJ71919.1 histidinol dehydrogenase [Thermosulfuriphilus ammonigenes]
MIPIYFLSEDLGQERLQRLKQRFSSEGGEYEVRVREILARIREEGDTALVEYTRQFDCPGFQRSDLRVRPEEIEAALVKVDRSFQEALEIARQNIENFHRRQLPHSWFETRDSGAVVGQMVRPVSAAGLYVPGGKGGETPLVSTVLMNAIPAKVAGVQRLVMVTPPGRDGRVSPHLLVAASLVGIEEIYRVGSAWAIGALAYGTETISPVEVICGPGNIYVALAKRLVAGEVGIDLVAGPSEILIIADETADPDYIAADLLSQAEHDPLALSLLVTTSEAVARAVAERLPVRLSWLPRKEIAEKALKDRGAIFIAEDIDQAVWAANQIAPEHLELLVADPFALLPIIKNAGAVFMGPYSPEPVGDYLAGPNHVLPTMGTARYASALSVENFLKKTSLIFYTQKALRLEAEAIVRLAEIEGLSAHAEAVRVRLKV